MKILRHIHLIIIIVYLTSCGESMETVADYPKSSFDSPFPKRNRNLTYILGRELIIKNGNDTLSLIISSSNKRNIITNSYGDTLFSGTVCQYRGLYYFNQQINDSSFLIYAVKITDKLIFGLNTALTQAWLVDEAIESGKNKKLVKYMTSDIYRLHPEKKELKILFTSIIDSITPDTILQFEEKSLTLADTTKSITKIDRDDFEYISKAYPNPTSDFITIELQQKYNITYLITNLQGQAVLQGQVTDNFIKIDLRKLTSGIYALILFNQKDNQKETIKIIKK